MSKISKIRLVAYITFVVGLLVCLGLQALLTFLTWTVIGTGLVLVFDACLGLNRRVCNGRAWLREQAALWISRFSHEPEAEVEIQSLLHEVRVLREQLRQATHSHTLH